MMTTLAMRTRHLVAIVLLSTACGGAPSPAGHEEILADVTAGSGLDFHYFNGMSGELFICEIMAPGCALFDSDNDGDLDVFVPQGTMLDPEKRPEQATIPPPQSAFPLTDRLFRNELVSEGVDTGTLRFVDVTATSGILGTGYGMGAATGDIDNDGDVDLLVTNLGPNQLWLNLGDGTFSEIAGPAGVADPRWSTSAVFFDFDRDGWLDLYVVNYVHFAVAINMYCKSSGGAYDYCAPLAYEPQPDQLLRNRGDGTFEDVSLGAGIGALAANGLGVVSLDFDDDGWIDLYVANDLMHNTLWRNQGDGTFVDEALLRGCATDMSGNSQSSMGVGAGDVDNDGDDDIFVGHMTHQASALYLNNSGTSFSDASGRSGVAALSGPYTTYGVAVSDIDNDGWLDVFVANGAMVNLDSQVLAGEPYPLREPNHLYRNRGGGVFESSSSRGLFDQLEVSRGAASGDLDNDGDIDLVITNSNGPARVFENRVGQDAHWVGLGVRGVGGRDMLGARVKLFSSDGSSQVRWVRTAGSYCSASDARVLFGLGRADGPVQVQVRWPDGTDESWKDLPVDRYHVLKRGSGLNGVARLPS